MRVLGPVMGRLQHELLQPMIDRCFAIMVRQGAFEQPPEELQGRDIDIELVSPLAKAQKQGELQSTMRGIEVLTQMAQIAPVLDYLDGDKMVSYLVDVMGMPAQIIRSSDEVAMVRRQQQQQAAIEQQQMAQLQEAEVMNKVAPMVKAQQS